MRICIPSDGEEGLAAAVAGHLGRAPFLTLVDTESGELSVVANDPHGEGCCSPARPLAGTDVEAVVCSGAGKRAVASLQAAGIRVLMTSAVTVQGAVTAARRGALYVLDAKDACGGHHGTGETERGRCRRQG
jgi:predicted Fe-Mo cluster-binding NifX family protein